MRIEKVWANMFGASKAHHDERDAVAAVADRSRGGEQNPQDPGKQGPDREGREEPSREELERAVAEMRSLPDFSGAGMAAEVVSTERGFSVRLVRGEGVIKTLTADEFMRLREVSKAEERGRGKILDQRF